MSTVTILYTTHCSIKIEKKTTCKIHSAKYTLVSRKPCKLIKASKSSYTEPSRSNETKKVDIGCSVFVILLFHKRMNCAINRWIFTLNLWKCLDLDVHDASECCYFTSYVILKMCQCQYCNRQSIWYPHWISENAQRNYLWRMTCFIIIEYVE